MKARIIIGGAFLASVATVAGAAGKPNVILCMADDLGWGDTGFSGHDVLKTPNLDRMAREGLRFDRFYAGAPVCSPTRASCLTGRHPYRFGITFANVGHMKPEEFTLAEVLREKGYATGHFGKWHLGTLTTTVKDGNRGKDGDARNYSPPWENGFEVCFSTESKVPTWDPMAKPSNGKGDYWNALRPGDAVKEYGTHYWLGPDRMAKENLEGDDSRIIMDRVIPFIQKAVEQKKPFFAVVWFHAPHLPVVAGPKFYGMYEGQDDLKRNYFGCITAMDEQVGRLRQALADAGVADDTMLWFCSDNGPEQGTPGRTNGLRDRKRSLHEGGVRVPGLLVWPGMIKGGRVTTMPCSTSDYLPTVLEVLGYPLPEASRRPYDGVSLLPLIRGQAEIRPCPIGFESQKQVALTDNRYKLHSGDGGKTFQLYDLVDDPGEKTNIAEKHPEVVAAMVKTVTVWRSSCATSAMGKDY